MFSRVVSKSTELGKPLGNTFDRGKIALKRADEYLRKERNLSWRKAPMRRNLP